MSHFQNLAIKASTQKKAFIQDFKTFFSRAVVLVVVSLMICIYIEAQFFDTSLYG